MRFIVISTVVFLAASLCFGERLSLDTKQGHFAMFTGIAFMTIEDMSDIDGFDANMNYIALGVGYAITDELDIQLLLPYQMFQAQGDLKDFLEAVGEDTSENDFADLSVEAIYELVLEPDVAFANVSFGFNLPTADEDKFGLGVTRFTTGVGVSYEGTPLVAGLDISFDFGEEPEDSNYDKNTTLSAEAHFGYRMTRESAVYLEYSYEEAHDEDDDPSTMAGLGVMFRKRDELQFQAAYRMGLNDYSPDMMIMLALIYQF